MIGKSQCHLILAIAGPIACLLVSTVQVNADEGFVAQVSGELVVGEQSMVVEEEFGQNDTVRHSVATVTSADGRPLLSVDAWHTIRPLTQTWKVCVRGVSDDLCVQTRQIYRSVAATHIVAALADVKPSTKGETEVLLNGEGVFEGTLDTAFGEIGSLREAPIEIQSAIARFAVATVGQETLSRAIDLIDWLLAVQRLQYSLNLENFMAQNGDQVKHAPLEAHTPGLEVSHLVLSRILSLIGAPAATPMWRSEQLRFGMSESTSRSATDYDGFFHVKD